MRVLPPRFEETSRFRFGTIGYGLDLPRLIWPLEHQVFSLQDHDTSKALPGRPAVASEGKAFSQQPRSFLKRNPVDVLLVEEGYQGKTRQGLTNMIENSEARDRPKCIAIAGPAEGMLISQHQARRKKRRKLLETLGYTSFEWLLSGDQFGGALEQERLFDIFLKISPGEKKPATLPRRRRATSPTHAEPPPSLWHPKEGLGPKGMDTSSRHSHRGRGMCNHGACT